VESVKYEDFSPGWPQQKVRHYLQNNQDNKGWQQVVKCFPSKRKALSSNTSDGKKKKKKRKNSKTYCRFSSHTKVTVIFLFL
jgi:hypothetical protein